MKTLYLVRHAKSAWHIDHIEDRDRPLKGRGIRDAHLVSTFLRGNLAHSEKVVVYSSPATRALHTALIFCKVLGLPASKVRIVEDLYHAPFDVLHSVVRGTEDGVDTVFMFAHNPSITEYVNYIAGQSIDNVPTTGVACLRFGESSWADAGLKAELIHFEYPKRIKQ